MRKGLARGQYLGNARLAPHKRVRACTRACRPPLPLKAATTIISLIVSVLHVAHKKRHRNENFVNAYARFAQSNCSNHQNCRRRRFVWKHASAKDKIVIKAAKCIKPSISTKCSVGYKFAKGANARARGRWQELFKTDPARVCNYLPNLLPFYKPEGMWFSSPKILTLSTNETGRQARSQRPIFDNAPLRARRRKHKKGSICQSQYSLRRSSSLKICRANTSLATRKIISGKRYTAYISELHNRR